MKLSRVHEQEVLCLQFDDRKVVSGSWDCTIAVTLWDPSRYLYEYQYTLIFFNKNLA